MTAAARPGFTARQYLKDATAMRHRTLDAGFAMLDLRNRPDYRHFLAVQAAVLAPLEASLTRHGIQESLPDWPLRCRSDALLDDLLALGGIPIPYDIDLPSPTTAALMGMAYVLEGSRLGAQFLARTVAASPDAQVRDNMRFLRHGAGQRLWASFLPALESTVDAEALEDAADGARRAFDLFLDAQRRHAPAEAGV